MRIFKFGGASVQDAAAVRNVGEILKKFEKEPLVIIISAMGKTTNALELALEAWWAKKDYLAKIEEIRDYHFKIIKELFEENDHLIYEEIENTFLQLEMFFEKPQNDNFDLVYDQIVSYGELLSTRIISRYLGANGFPNKWLDARNFVITDDLFRDARIQWEPTTRLIRKRVLNMANELPIITQGFIGSTLSNLTTTLGREGSDFTASIFANALDADEVVIWKDVPGILNADPKKFPKTVKFDKLSYLEAIEMTYYGARVLHPKTIKPIQNKNIPLNVRSFMHPDEPGTIIKGDIPTQTEVPIIILKENQLLLKLATRDFSFIAEENIKIIFEEVVKNGIKVNVMSNSAVSFHICVDEMSQKITNFINSLEKEFIIEKVEHLQLLTIKHADKASIPELIAGKEVVMKEKSGNTIQFILK